MIKECVAIIYNTIWQNEQNSSTQQTKKYKIKHKTVSVKNYSLEFIICSCTENALRKISYGHWYYTQANYKHDHGLSNYRPSEEVEVHTYIHCFSSIHLLWNHATKHIWGYEQLKTLISFALIMISKYVSCLY